MKRFYLALALLGASCASIALPEKALAVTTTKVTLSSTAWTDLGVGPMQLNSGGTQVLYAIADTVPPLPPVGFAVPTDTNQVVNTASHVWAIAATPNAAFVDVAPVAINSGGGGTFTWPGSSTVTTYGVAPTGTVPAVNAFCTNCAPSSGGPLGVQPISNSQAVNPATASTWPITAAALPLPAGAATAANQQVTAAGTSAGAAQAVQGVAGGVPLTVSGSFGVSITGFTPSASGARMSSFNVQLTDTSGPLPNGPSVVVDNIDLTDPVYCNVNGVAATVADKKIPPNSWYQFTIPVGQTTLHCIATGGTAFVNGLGGSGLATGAGGGATGGGSGSSGPLGVQPVSNSQAVNPATASVWTVTPNAGASFPVTGASGSFLSGAYADGAIIGIGALADAAWTAGPGSIIAVLKKIAANTAAGGGAVSLAAGADVSEGNITDPAWSGAGNTTVIGALKALVNGVNAGYDSGSNSTRVSNPSPYPLAAVPITASNNGTTAATTATLTNVVGHLTYICGYSIRANATAVATGDATVTGTISGTMHFTQWTAPNTSGLGVNEQIFQPCIPASAISTSISVNSAAPGAGGVVSVSAWGFSI